MECPACGRYSPPDPDTGYDGDDICGPCAREGWTVDSSGEVVREPMPDVGETFEGMREAVQQGIDIGATLIRCRLNDGPEVCVNHGGYSGPSQMCPTCGSESECPF